jgi:ATPase subunit of ABC transporter with duplicated ATPase domains
MSYEEYVEIEILRRQGNSLRDIAVETGMSVNTAGCRAFRCGGPDEVYQFLTALLYQFTTVRDTSRMFVRYLSNPPKRDYTAQTLTLSEKGGKYGSACVPNDVGTLVQHICLLSPAFHRAAITWSEQSPLHRVESFLDSIVIASAPVDREIDTSRRNESKSMTTLISALSLQLESGHGPLFHDLSFTVKQGDRIGLLGHNGCGKSSLLGLLAGSREPSAGSVQYAGQCRLQHVEQHLPSRLAGLTVRETLLEAIDKQPEQHWRVDSLLNELALPEAADTPVDSLSGGQHTRLLLGRAVLQEPNLLLLDEPSNHLDLPSLLWLEDFLRRWQGGFILVSHDPRLLDTLSDKSWILRDQQLYSFDLPCSQALVALAEADVAAQLRHAGEQKEIDRLAASSKRVAIWGREHDNEKLLRQAKNIQRRADKLKDDQTFVSRGSPWHLKLQGTSLAADSLLAFENLQVRAQSDQPVLFEIEALWLRPGDKVALLGSNGAGKSSLLRQCWSDVQEGEARAGWRYHPAARVAYYDQSLRQLADEATLADALYKFAPVGDRERRQALISAGFAYSRHGQTVASLSGGERARLLFLALSMASYHLLWLDEPTNHLDLDGKRELAAALSGFAGGFLLVSHDRELIENSCNRFWVISNGRVQEWPDTASAYQSLFATSDTVRPEPAPVAPPDPVVQPSSVSDEAELQWQRWCQLEAWLETDRARKPKHQKPHLQQEWQQEMRRLEESLGL